MPTNDETIASNLTKPQSITTDNGSVTQHNLKDQIAAAEYLNEKTAGTKTTLPIRFAKLKPGGTA